MSKIFLLWQVGLIVNVKSHFLNLRGKGIDCMYPMPSRALQSFHDYMGQYMAALKMASQRLWWATSFWGGFPVTQVPLRLPFSVSWRLRCFWGGFQPPFVAQVLLRWLPSISSEVKSLHLLCKVQVHIGVSKKGDHFGTVVGEDPTDYVILALWAVNGLSIVCWGFCHFFFLRLPIYKFNIIKFSIAM